jgi:hypothetical protein
MGEAPGWGTQPVIGALATLGTSALPVCLGVAVLKYRLYELNRVVSRVVSYALITALLAGVFAGLILLADRVLAVKGSVAEAVVADFNARLRQTVDLDALRYDLLGVTEDASSPRMSPCGWRPCRLAGRIAPPPERVAGFQQGLEVEQAAGPALGDARHDGAGLGRPPGWAPARRAARALGTGCWG